MAGTNRAIFLDRDGTLIEDVNYLTRPEQLKLLAGAADAVARLRAAGFAAILVTNQSAVARGMMSEADLAAVHKRLGELLVEANRDARLDGIYYCPYHPQATVPEFRQSSYLCKPRPGMLFKAAREFQLDLGSCWMIGDSERDVQAGKSAGCRAIRLSDDPGVETSADAVAGSLADAVRLVRASPGRAPLKAAGPVAQPTPSGSPPPAAAKSAVDRPETTEELPMAADAKPDSPEPAPQPPELAPQNPPPQPAAPEPVASRRPLGEIRQRLLDQIEQEKRSAATASDRDDDAPAREPGDTRRVLAEILQQLRQINRGAEKRELSATKILGGLFQVVSWAMMALAVVSYFNTEVDAAIIWGLVGVFTQVASLAFILMHHQD